MSGSSYVGKTACEGKKFYVEVTGVQHGKEQAIQFYDLTNMTEQEALENKQEVDEKEETSIFSWDWCDETENRNVWLSIPTEDQPIKLPLFEDVTSYNLRSGDQDYLLQSVVPMTLMPSIITKDGKTISKVDDKDRVAPLKEGYLYIAYKGKVWREIKITSTEDGLPEFRDINLYSYRKGRDKEFKIGSDQRKPTGVALKDIWIPVKDNNKNVSSLYIAYSEVQWSMERLKYFEEKESHIFQRMEKLTAHSYQLSTDLPEMRAREQQFELKLSNPIAFNRDLTGKKLLERLNQARHLSYEYKKLDDYTQDHDILFEYKARMTSLSEDLNKSFKKKETADDSGDITDHSSNSEKTKVAKKLVSDARNKEKELGDLSCDIEKSWTAEAKSNYLLDAQKRKLRFCIVNDPIFLLRHHNAVLVSAQQYLQFIHTDATLQRDFRSAQLLQMFVIPPKYGDKENPLHKFADNINYRYASHSIYHKTMRTYLRLFVRRDIRELQQTVFDALTEKSFSFALRDITSLNDNERARGAYNIVNNCRHAIQLDSHDQDSLLPEYEKIRDPNLFIKLNKLFFNDSKHPLKLTLLGEDDEYDEVSNYIEGTTSTKDYLNADYVNDGTGIAQLAHIIRLGSQDIKPDENYVLEQPEAIASLAQTGSLAEGYTLYQERLILDKVNNMFSSYYTAALTAKMTYDSKSENLRKDLKTVQNALEEMHIGKLMTKVSAYSKAWMSKIADGLSFKSTFKANPNLDMIMLYMKGTNNAGVIEEFGNNLLRVDSAPVHQEKTNNFGRGGTRTSMTGDFHDASGNTVASTSKARLGAGENTTLSQVKAFFIDKNKSPEAAKIAPTLENNIADLKRYKSKNVRDIARGEHMDKFNAASAYKKAGIPMVFLFFEMWNLHSAMSVYMQKKKLGYEPAFLDQLNILSALGDSGVAIAQVYETLSQNTFKTLWNAEETRIGKGLAKAFKLNANSAGVSATEAAESSASRIGLAVGGEITFLTLAGAVFGVLTGCLLVVQGIVLFCHGDTDAGLAMIAAGTILIIGSILTVFITSVSFLSIPIIGWIIFALVSIFCLLGALWTDSPLEKWIKQSVFGYEADHSSDYDFIREDPQVAYLQLLNIFVCVQLYSGIISSTSTQYKLTDEQEAQLSKQLRVQCKQEGATHFVRLSTNAMAFFGLKAKDIKFHQKFQATDIKTIISNGMVTNQKSKPVSIKPFKVIELPDGKLYLFKSEYAQKPFVSGFGGYTTMYSTEIEALAQIEVGNYIFPQPSLDEYKETLQYLKDNKIAKSVANFSDGQTHGIIQYMFDAPAIPKNAYWADTRD
ncbi:toxin VasX [Vibrio salinus]|uniref:toxin VasX n=1 Tax=Vibrio salinus TaxID=2899784 RepID=UPI001E2BF59E|nr:toxin VasX [Vibrio salinus]MCE0495149.1 hypothetical protein [Vibrio salinus]